MRRPAGLGRAAGCGVPERGGGRAGQDARLLHAADATGIILQFKPLTFRRGIRLYLEVVLYYCVVLHVCSPLQR